jgi:anti-sigma B factor antagonist
MVCERILRTVSRVVRQRGHRGKTETAVDLGISFERDGEALVAIPDGEIDVASATKLRDELLTALANRPPRLVVDLSQVTFLDSTGLAALVAVYRRATEQETVFALAAPTRIAGKVLSITGLDRAWPVFDSRAEAVAASVSE